MSSNDKIYAAVQNGVILDMFSSREEAVSRAHQEMKKDLLSIVFRKHLRKLFKKSGNIALHRYQVIVVSSVEEVLE